MELAHVRLPWKPTVIAPLGDIQWAGFKEQIAFDALRTHVERALELDAWFVGMGDYIDYLSPSNRQRLAAANLYETALRVQDETAERLVRQLYEEVLKPTRGRWLGLLEGHHFSTLSTGITTDMRLCELLQARFLGTSAFIRLTFAAGQKGPGRALEYDVWAHHGHGGGASAAAPVTKLMGTVMPYWEADLFLIGHMTKIAAAPVDRCYPLFDASPPRLKHREVRLVGTGGWLKGYEEHVRIGNIPRGGYVERGMMAPVALGAPLVFLTPCWEEQPRLNEQRVRNLSIRARVEV